MTGLALLLGIASVVLVSFGGWVWIRGTIDIWLHNASQLVTPDELNMECSKVGQAAVLDTCYIVKQLRSPWTAEPDVNYEARFKHKQGRLNYLLQAKIAPLPPNTTRHTFGHLPSHVFDK